MKIVRDTVINEPVDTMKKASEYTTEEAKDAFKKIFLEKMFSEMLKTGSTVPGTSELEKEIYRDKMAELLADKFVETTDIRWEQIFGNAELKTKKEE